MLAQARRSTICRSSAQGDAHVHGTGRAMLDRIEQQVGQHSFDRGRRERQGNVVLDHDLQGLTA
jgi:hypothetical protein